MDRRRGISEAPAKNHIQAAVLVVRFGLADERDARSA
jgi:hypothetical protein